VRIIPLNTNQRILNEIKCHVEIEPLIFKGKLYKILKFKDFLSSKGLPTPSIQGTNLTSNLAKNPRSDEFADRFPNDVERDSSTNDPEIQASIANIEFEAKDLQIRRGSTHVVESQDDKKRFVISEALPSKKSKKGKTASIITSQHTNRSTARQLNSSLKIEKQSPRIKIVVHLIYLAIMIIIASIVIDLVFSNRSIQNMANSMSLIGTVNSRLGKTIVAWQSVLILYTRSIKLRPIDYRVPKYQAVILQTSSEMLKNGQELMKKVDNFGDKDVVKTFYEKRISFYEPADKSLFDHQKIDSFIGHAVLTEYSMFYGRYNKTITDLAGNRKVVFAMNNTANDFLLALDYSISKIGEFFDDTRTTNIKLLTGIVSLESFFVVIPCVLILLILIMTVKLYSQLFQALCKVHPNSLAWRIKHLENFSELFNENIEDDISAFHSFKWQESVKQRTVGNMDNMNIHASRNYSGQSLVIYGLKYVLLAFLLTAVIITLITTALHRSVENFDSLDKINDRIMTVYDIASKVKMVQPSYFFAMIFFNNTDYTIRNSDPIKETIKYLDALGDSNNILLSSLTNENNEIDDPVVKDILSGQACKYCDKAYYNTCLTQTNGQSFGLLGIQPKMYDVFSIMRGFLESKSKTQALAVQKMIEYGVFLNDLHFILYSIHDSLAAHLIGVFMKTADEKKDQVLRTFFINITVTIFSLALIRVIVLDKLRRLDIGIRRILRIIPYKIIEDNKVMAHYLNRAFDNEIKILKQFSN